MKKITLNLIPATIDIEAICRDVWKQSLVKVIEEILSRDIIAEKLEEYDGIIGSFNKATSDPDIDEKAFYLACDKYIPSAYHTMAKVIVSVLETLFSDLTEELGGKLS